MYGMFGVIGGSVEIGGEGFTLYFSSSSLSVVLSLCFPMHTHTRSQYTVYTNSLFLLSPSTRSSNHPGQVQVHGVDGGSVVGSCRSRKSVGGSGSGSRPSEHESECTLDGFVCVVYKRETERQRDRETETERRVLLLF